MSPRLTEYLEDYESDHQNVWNQLCHAVGIPLIVLSTLGLLAQLVIPGVPTFCPEALLRADAGLGLWFFGILWCLYVDWRIGIPFSLVTLGVYFVGRFLPFNVLIELWVGGWVLQFVGHGIFEKKKPAFFRSIKHLVIGPLWIFVRLTGYP